MLSRRLAVRLLLAGALTSSPTLLAVPPTVAADTWSTTVVALPGETVVDFGEVVDIEVDVDSESGSAPTDGTATLLARPATSTSWQTVATSSSPSAGFLAVKPRMNTTYKVTYSGSKASSSQDDSYSPSESAEFEVQVARTITRPSGGFVIKGRIRPDYGTRKIIVKVSRKQYSGYTRYRTIVTDKRGRYRLTLPRRKGTWYWSFTARGDERYRSASFRWRTWVS